MSGSNDDGDEEKATGRYVGGPFGRLARGDKNVVLGGRYRIVESLGSSGAVDIHVAVDRFLEREVLIEVLRADVSATSEGIAAFRRAAVALAEAESPHLLAVHDVGIDSAGVYLVVQRPAGPSLLDEIGKRGPMAPLRGVKLVQQVLIGLAAVHAAGLVHGEVTPSNVVLTSRDRAVLRPPPILAGGDRPGEQVKLSPPGLGRVPFVRQRTGMLHETGSFARWSGRRSLTTIR